MLRGIGVILLIGFTLQGEFCFSTSPSPSNLSLNQLLKEISVGDATALDRSINRMKSFLLQKPQEVDLYNRLGALLMQKARETGDLDWYDKAEKCFLQAQAINSEDAVTLRNLAWIGTIRHRFREALRYARQAIQKNPSDPLAYGLLSDAYLELGQYEQALETAQKMIDLRPDQGSYSRGAYLRWLYGDAKGAIFLMRKAIEAGSPYAENTAWCRVRLGEIYFKTGNLRAAEDQYQLALQQFPRYIPALAGMARVRASQKKYDEAIHLLTQATAEHPPIPYVIELGDLYLKLGRKQEAEKQYERVEKIVQEHLKRGIEGDELILAMFYLDHDRHLDKALRLAEAEIKDHQSIEAYTALAWAYYKHKRYPEAEKALLKALRLNTQDALLFYRAGKIYQALGDKNRARRYLFSAVNLNPSFHPLYAEDAYRFLSQNQ